MSDAVRLVIWDLDETFWRGTLTEGGLIWRDDTQAIVVELARRGIMSAICSKNDFEPVKAILARKGVWDYFIFPSVNWSPKGPRIRRLIDTVQLRAPSVLLVDDNHLNLEEAKHFAPGLQVAPETVIPELLDDPRLRGKDDHALTRLKQYKVLEARKADEDRLGETEGDNAAFLRASDLRVRIENDVEAHLDRAIELINRTNQLNFTKRRLPEDPERARVKLRGEISHFATQAGLIQVSDKYGDYGYCGYFQVTTRRDVIQLRQFCFSCRILGMGVEAWLYRRLGRPALEISGEVLSDPVSNPPVDWIRMAPPAAATEDGAASAEPALGSMAARGGCVLWPLTHYFRLTSPKVVGEFNTVRDGKMIPLDHSLCLRHAILGVTPEQMEALAPLGFVAEDFHTQYFDHCGEKPLWVFSNWVDSGTRVYQHRRTGIAIPCPPPKTDAQIAAYAGLEDYLTAEFSRIQYDETQFKDTLHLICSRIPPHGLMFVLLSETQNPRRQERNRWLQEVTVNYANIQLIRLRDFIGDTAEIHNEQVTHFDRKVYHRLYEHMVARAKASLSEQARAPAV